MIGFLCVISLSQFYWIYSSKLNKSIVSIISFCSDQKKLGSTYYFVNDKIEPHGRIWIVTHPCILLPSGTKLI